MSLKTRLFGKKLKGEELANFMDILKIDKCILNNSSTPWSTVEYWGRCLMNPNKDRINVDLYIFRKDVHWVDGSLPHLDKRLMEQNKERTSIISRNHYEKDIPYNKISLEEKS